MAGAGGYVPPSMDELDSTLIDEDPFASATHGLDAIDVDAPVPSAVPAASTSGAGNSNDVVLSFHEDASLASQPMAGKIGQSSGQVPRADVPRPAAAVPRAPETSGGGGGGGSGEASARYSRFNVKYYRSYFNVDTADVGHRMLDSVLCALRPNFLEKHGHNPDLYGPFWIASTIVFLIAVVSNFIGWHNHGSASESTQEAWKYDVDKVSYAAILFYGYVGAIGFGIWAVLRWFKSAVTLAEIWCVYGYGMSVFVPMAIFCAFPSDLAGWVLVGTSTALSGLFILLNLRHAVFESAGAKALPLYISMACCHALLGLVLKGYFFKYSKLK